MSPWSQPSDLSDEDDVAALELSAYINLPASCQSVDSILDQLTRISVAIKKSGNRFRHERADSYLNLREHRDFVKHLGFVLLWSPLEEQLASHVTSMISCGNCNNSTLIAIRYWLVDPTRMTPVQVRLVRANVKRRNRFIRARASPRSLPGSEDFSERLQLSHYASESSDANDNPIRVPDPQTAPSTVGKQNTATDIGSNFVMPQLPAKSTVSRVSRTGATLDYPSRPQIEQGRHTFECPFCRQVLPEQYAKEGWR